MLYTFCRGVKHVHKTCLKIYQTWKAYYIRVNLFHYVSKYITLMKYSVIILFSIWKLRSWFNCRFCIVGKVTFSDCTSETIYTRSKLSIFLQGFGIQIIALGVCIWKHNSSTKGIIFAHFQFTRIYGTLLNFFNLNLIWLQWRRRAVFSGAGWGDILLPFNLFQEKKKKKINYLQKMLEFTSPIPILKWMYRTQHKRRIASNSALFLT